MATITKGFINLRLLIIIGISLNTTVSAQNVDFRIVDSAKKSIAKGDNFIEYSGYSLIETISGILNLPKGLIQPSAPFEDFPVYIKIRSDSGLTSEVIKRTLFNTLVQSLNINPEFKSKYRNVYTAQIVQKNKLKECANENNGEVSKIVQINRTWNADCVPISSLLDQLSLWYGYLILDETDDENSYNFSINNDDWEVINQAIQFNYGIAITQKKKRLSVLHLIREKQ